MTQTVQVRVTAAIVVDGEIARPGDIVSVPLDIAAMLVRRGRVARAGAVAQQAPQEPAQDAFSGEDEQSPEDAHDDAPAPRKPGRPRKH